MFILVFMSASSSCQPILQVDMLLNAHINVHVNLKLMLVCTASEYVVEGTCQPQVQVSLCYKGMYG